MLSLPSGAQDLPRGQVLDRVACLDDATQTYALYLPSTYTPGRSWPVLIGFHPGARGRAIVEKYRDAAETFGYIVAASNVSRNGPWEVSARAAQAMFADVGRRFAADPARVYLTGHSGGARVSMQIALAGNRIAGVIASSGGYPDAQPRRSVPFLVFGTAGTADFNYIEMRRLDRALRTPHRVVIFEGGHTLPPDEVALEAIEWLELRAMIAGTRPRDEALVDRLWQKRLAAAGAPGGTAAAVHLLQAMAEDFAGLRDVQAIAARARDLSQQKAIERALQQERDDDEAEMRLLDRVLELEAGLRDEAQRANNLASLRALLAECFRQAGAADDSPLRRRSRRVLRAISMGAAERVQDPDYLKILEQFRLKPA
jgi:hypothetical protein